MATAKVVARNLIANWIGYGSNLVVMLFLSPFILHSLGMVQYGVWQLLTVLTGYMGVLDLGVRASTGRYIIFYLGKREYDKVDETIKTGLGLYAAVGVIILFASILIAWAFPYLFPSVPDEYHEIVSVILPILAVNIWISAFRTVLSTILTAHERFDLARGSDLIMLAVRAIGTVVAINLGFELIGLVAALVLCNIVGLLVNYTLAHKVHHGLKLWPLKLNKDRVSELYKYGVGAFVSTASISVIGQSDLFIVGSLISVDSVATYSVGAMLLYYSNTFLNQISHVLFPSLQKAVVRGEMGSARWLLFRQIRLAMIFGIAMYVGYISFSKSFISLWMYHPEKFPFESVDQAALVMVILASSKLPVLFGFGCRPLLAATGHIGFTAKLTVVEAITNLTLSIVFVLVFAWGLAGVAAGTLIARLLTSAIILPLYACHKAGINWWRYVIIVGGSGVASGCLFTIVCYCVQQLLPGRDWLGFFIQVAIALLCYVPIVLIFLVSSEDRQRLRKKILVLNPS